MNTVAANHVDSSTPQGQPWRWLFFLFVSLLLHLGGLWLLDRYSLFKQEPSQAKSPQKMQVTIERVPPPVLPPATPPAPVAKPRLSQQIVDAPPVYAATPKDKAFLGVRDNAVPEEMIARERGRAENRQEQLDADPSASQVEQQSQQTREQLADQGIQLAKLLPDPYKTTSRPAGETSRQQNAVDRKLGPLTLLNTKSHPYAQYLIDRGYRALRLLTMNSELTTWYYGDVRYLQLPAAVTVSLGPEGQVLSTLVEQSSGSSKIDGLMLNALRGAVNGVPPPEESLENGRVQIVLVLEPDVLKIGIK